MGGGTVDLRHIRLRDRPLVVCDVDDVALRFIDPFQTFLESEGHTFLPRSFRLHGNILSKTSGLAIDEAQVAHLIEAFFEAQESWQTPFDLVVQALDGLSSASDVLFLTAMPPKFQDQRRRLLDRVGLTFPLIATEEPKGPIVQALHAGRPLPVAFIDDMARNLHSVREHVAECLLVHLMPDSPVHQFAPTPEVDVHRASDWSQAAELIRNHIGANRLLTE